MHLVELCAPVKAPAPWSGEGTLSRSKSLDTLSSALDQADCVLVHHAAPELPELLASCPLPVVVCSEEPSAAQAVACMRAGAADLVSPSLAEQACRAALGQARGEPSADALLSSTHRQALEQERLALIGRLSWGLAHEILNPATFVVANLEETRACIQDLQPLLRYGMDLALLHGDPATLQAYKRQARWPEALQELDELLDESQEGMARINNLVNDIKAYGPTDLDARDIDLRRLCQRVFGLARKELERFQVDLEIERVPPVHASPARLATLVSSLLGLIVKRPVSVVSRSLRVRCVAHAAWVEIHLHDSAPFPPGEDSVELARTQLGLAFGRELVARLKGELRIHGDQTGLDIRLRLPAELPLQRDLGAASLSKAAIVAHAADPAHRAHLADVLRCGVLHVLPTWPPAPWLHATLGLLAGGQGTEGLGFPVLPWHPGEIPYEEITRVLAKGPHS